MFASGILLLLLVEMGRTRGGTKFEGRMFLIIDLLKFIKEAVAFFFGSQLKGGRQGCCEIRQVVQVRGENELVLTFVLLSIHLIMTIVPTFIDNKQH